MSQSFIQRIAMASVCALSWGVSPAANAAYSWTEILVPSIGPLGGAFGINDRDQVAVTNAAGSQSGIYRNGIFTPLAAAPAGYKVSALGINNGGVITGGAYSPADPTHEQGFVLVGSTYTFFSRPGWDNTEARAISRSGLVTGYSYQDAGGTAGFVYDPAAHTFTDVTPPGTGAVFSTPQGMNAKGRIAGDGRLAGMGRYAYIWQQGTLVKGKRQFAPFLARFTIGDGGTVARGISDAGIIAGFTNSGGMTLGFVGSDSRGFQLLVPPGGDAAGASVACEGVNNDREVVCQVTDAAGNTRAFVGAPEGDDHGDDHGHDHGHDHGDDH